MLSNVYDNATFDHRRLPVRIQHNVSVEYSDVLPEPGARAMTHTAGELDSNYNDARERGHYSATNANIPPSAATDMTRMPPYAKVNRVGKGIPRASYAELRRAPYPMVAAASAYDSDYDRFQRFEIGENAASFSEPPSYNSLEFQTKSMFRNHDETNLNY